MFSTALWVLDQEQKVYERHFGSPTTHESELSALALTGAGVQTAVLGGSPYRGMIYWYGHEEFFQEQLFKHSRRSAGGKGVPLGFTFGKGISGFQFRFMKASFGRKLAAKVATRFIPGLGWALFAVDMWHVGKWIGRHTVPT
jgi:hypothetical protein